MTAASDLGNAVEILVFPALVQAAGLAPALALAALLTLALAAFAASAVPETRHRTPDQIYDLLCPELRADPTDVHVDKHDTRQCGGDRTDCNKNSSEINNINDDKDLKIGGGDDTLFGVEAVESAPSDKDDDVEKDHDKGVSSGGDEVRKIKTRNELSENNGSEVEERGGDASNGTRADLRDGGRDSVASCVSSNNVNALSPDERIDSEIEPKDKFNSIPRIGDDETRVKEDDATEETEGNANKCSMGKSDATTVHRDQLNNVSAGGSGADTVLTRCCSNTECTNM